MNEKEISLQDMLFVIGQFEHTDPFHFNYAAAKPLMDKMGIAKIVWLMRVCGELKEEACVYDSGIPSCGEPYIRIFECNDEIQRTVQVFRRENTEPWNENQLAAVKMFHELIFVYGSCTVLRKHAFDAQNLDADTHIPSFQAYRKFVMKQIAEKRIEGYAALYINVKNCKLVNKFYGFPAGTRILAEYAHCCCAKMEEDEIFARLGGDNFVVLVKKDNLNRFLEQMKSVQISMVLNGRPVDYSFSCRAGIYLADSNIKTIDKLMNNSARALSLARQPQAEDYVYYDMVAEKTILHLNELEVEMEAAMEREDYLVYFQPKVSTRDKKLVGAEALIRWNYFGKTISPVEFIPVFERTGFIVKVDFYMLNKVCQQIRSWLDQGISPVPISVNFSRAHLSTENLAQRIRDVVASYDLSPDYIEIEFTETAYINETENLSRVVAELKQSGIGVSMDDFGSGYSSLCLLQDLMFDVLKIDKSLVGDVSNRRKAVVLEHIIQMAKELRMYVVCEGVETIENLHFLERTSCDMIQGFLFDRPLPTEEFEQRLLNKHYVLE